jgi:hypothetical protein
MDVIIMQTEIKKGRGKPRGYVEYPRLMEAIKATLKAPDAKPMNASQIRKAVAQGQGKKQVLPNKDTVKHYLQNLVGQGLAREIRLGDESRPMVFYEATPQLQDAEAQ